MPSFLFSAYRAGTLLKENKKRRYRMRLDTVFPQNGSRTVHLPVTVLLFVSFQFHVVFLPVVPKRPDEAKAL